MINIPTPKEGETQKEFISRCIPYLIHEGKHPNNPKGRKAAAGECYGIWRSSKKSDDDNPIIKAGLKDNTGYFCRLENSDKKYYYELDKPETKEEAIKKASEEWIELKSDELVKLIDIPVEEKAVPNKIGEGTNIVYKGKKGKIIKVINT